MKQLVAAWIVLTAFILVAHAQSPNIVSVIERSGTKHRQRVSLNRDACSDRNLS